MASAWVATARSARLMIVTSQIDCQGEAKEIRFAVDSALEGDGFEPSVPRKAPDTNGDV